MGKRAGPPAEISASGLEFSHMNTPPRLPERKMLKCACVEGITYLIFQTFK